MAPAALGTDTGGSVRNPATCCGIVGLKPTYGAVSLSGVFPLTYSLDHVGPMTRTVEDNAILFHAIAGHDPDDPTTAPRATPDCLKDLKAGLKGLRIGVIEHFYTEDAEADPEQVRAIEQAVARAAKARRQREDRSACRRCRCGPTATAPSIRPRPTPIHEKDVQERPEDFAALTRNRLLARRVRARRRNTSRRSNLRAALCREMAEATRDLDAVITLSSLLLPCRIDDPAAIARTYDQQCRLRVQRHRHAGDLGADRPHRRTACRSPCRSPAMRSASRWSIASRRPTSAATGFADEAPADPEAACA